MFEIGDAETFSERIQEDESPIAWASLSGSRPIYVQHIGEDPLVNWFAIDARSPSNPVACSLSWDTESQVFLTNATSHVHTLQMEKGLHDLRLLLTLLG